VRVFLVGLLAAASACMSSTYVGSARPFAPEQLESEPGWLAVRDVPVVRQESEIDCGAAAIAMVVTYWTTEPAARLLSELRPVRKPGLEAGRLRDFARRRDLAAYLVSAEVADLERELAAGRPVLVGLVKPQVKGGLTHYEVVVAIHRQQGVVVTLDPAEGWRQNDLRGFLAEWKPAANLALVVVGREERAAQAAPKPGALLTEALPAPGR
jgi:ABC-type bacteriocin/lantibiotic exporter with double-glycine peptidase domain